MRVVVLLACALGVGSCASVTRGWNDQVRFSSAPSEAHVRTSTGFQCVTPCQVTVGRKEEFVAVFSKPGYESREVLVKPQLAGTGAAGFAGNVVLGGVIGAGVDLASGATLDHCPNPVSVTLRRTGSRDQAGADPRGHCEKPRDPAEIAEEQRLQRERIN